jgi:hypothetical protein
MLGTLKAFGLFFRSFRLLVLMGNPLIAGFVEMQNEPKTWAWSVKTTEVKLALPTAKIQPR